MKNFVKKFVVSFMAIVFAAALNAQSLRDYVCVVEGNLSEETNTFLTEIKDSLERNGYTYYAGYVNAFLKGTFGSGFIWYGPDGKPYIVTNRHVVSNYQTVNLTFENEDGSVSEFKEMKIQFIDDDVDLALIALPATFKKEGLSFVSKRPSDGDDVFSAGFPGLAGEPSWQLGKGVVSNSSAKIKELINPEISTLIQHTAQIDGGNSGGPLLIRDSSAKVGYKVCGVNTWSAVRRQNTNFSIPAATVEAIVKSNYINKEKTNFDTRSIAFIKAVSDKDDFTGVVPYISNSMVSKFGEKALKDVLGKASSNVRTYISDVFEHNPVDGLRYAIAYSVWSRIKSEERIDIGEVSAEATGKKVTFKAGETSYSSFWIEEHGSWKLEEFDGIKADKKLSNKEKARNQHGSIFSVEDPYIMSVSGGYLKNLTESYNSFYADFAYRANFFTLGVAVSRDKVTSNPDKNSYYAPSEIEITLLQFGPFVQLKLPLKFDRVLIMPYGEAKIGVGFISGDWSNADIKPIFAGFGGGLELAYNSDSGFSPFVGAKYLKTSFPGDVTESYSVKDFIVYVGIKIGEK